jgi:hypothetical protein
MPRSSQTFSLRDALLEQARREMLRRKQAESTSIDFPDWLKEVFPDFTWDWAYLQYIQAHLQKVTRLRENVHIQTRIIRRWDTAQTPFARLLATVVLT